MIITYHGGQFVKITHGDLVVATNPFGKGSKMKPIRFGARIALVSADHPDMNGVENLSHGEKVPFVIAGPGEYEVADIAVSGFPSPKPYGKDELLNTIYTLEFEGIRLCMLGALSTPDLPPDTFEGIGQIDVLIVPVSGEGVLQPAEAAKIAVVFGAKLIIPVAWSDEKDPNLKAFLKSAGAENITTIEKLILKKKDLEGKEGNVVLLSPLAHS
jgi:L-ascorbate metabolism protein UlaG (beta-lactamase superfamily)